MTGAKKFGQRILSMLMATVCVIGLLPTSVFASEIATQADDVPQTVRLKAVAYGEEGKKYTSPSFSGELSLHMMTMDVGSLGAHDSFCAEHGKTMGTALVDQPWSSPTPVNNDVIKLMLGYYYTHKEGIFNDECIKNGYNRKWDPQGEYTKNMNAWVQAVCWRALGQGTPISGDVTSAIATELMAVYNNLNGTHHTDIMTDTVPGSTATYYSIAQEVVQNKSSWCDVDVYKYTYAGGAIGRHTPGGVQAMLVGIPKTMTDVPIEDQNKYSIVVKKVDATNPTKGLAGATFSLTKTDGSSGYLTGTTGQDGTVTFKDLVAGTYAVQETAAPAGYKLDDTGPRYVSVPQADATAIIFTDTPEGDATGNIRKVDKDNPTHGLSGATIKITGVDNNFTGEYQTGEGGALQDVPWDSMPVGSYVAEETGAPAGYILPDPHVKKEFYWDKKTPVNLVFENDSMVKLQLHKVDPNGNGLANAVFNVFKDGQLIETAATDGNGNLTVTGLISEGYYSFTEVSAPEGYEVNYLPIGVKVDAADIQGGATKTLTSVNYKRHSIKIVKIDAMSKGPISGVTFKYYWNNQYMGETNPTGVDGTTIVSNLQSGTYRFVENRAANGYSENKQEYNVTIDCQKETQNLQTTLEVLNYPLKTIKIVKKDGRTEAPIAGVQFNYYKDDKLMGKTEPTNEQGETTITNVDTGTYRLEEVKPAEGYAANTQQYNVHVDTTDNSKSVYTVDVTNYHLKDIMVVKTDAKTTEPIEGVIFKYYKNNEYVGTTEATDNNGQTTVKNVDTGTYRFVEVNPAPGYADNASEYNVYVDVSDTKIPLYTVGVENNHLKEIVIVKRDAKTLQPIQGVTFKYYKDNQYMGTTDPTNAEGKTFIHDVNTGTYRFEEVAPMDGYSANLVSQDLNVDVLDTDKMVYTVDFVNYPLKDIVLVKKDANSLLPIAGVSFNYYKDNQLIGTTEPTDENGKTRITGVDSGTYRFEEVQPAPGYDTNDRQYNLTVDVTDVTNMVYTLDITNYPLKEILVIKKDAKTLKPIAGVSFRYYKDNEFCGTTDPTDTSGRTKITSLGSGTYTFEEVKPAEGYASNDEKYTVEVNVYDDDKQSYTLDVVNYPLKKIVIVKQDGMTQKPIQGVSFNYYRDNQLIGTTAPTDANGETTITDAESGTYRFVEVKPAPGYAANTQEYHLEVDVKDDSVPVYRLNVVNYPLKKIVVVKKDAMTLKPIAGVSFNYYKDNQLVGTTNPTDDKGETTITDIESGTYTFEEVKPAEGYAENHQKYTVEVDVSDDSVPVYTLNVVNYPLKKIVVVKKDAMTLKPIAGVSFNYYKDNQLVGTTAPTDDQGETTVTNIESGTYTFEEVKPAEGYAENHQKYTVEVDVTDDSVPVYTLNVVNYPLKKIVVVKKDAMTLEPIEGVSFNYYKDNQLVGTTAPTDAKGETTITDIESGTYVFEEVKPAEGYATNKEKYTVEVDVSDDSVPVYTLNVVNYPLKKIVIVKKDAYTLQPIAGVSFNYYKDNQLVGTTAPTDEFGKTTVNDVESGTYRFVEVKPAEGYAENKQEYHVEVDVTDDSVPVYTLEVVNYPLKQIVVIKKDAQTKQPIAGVSFKYYLDNQYMGTTDPTDENGRTTVSDINSGTYTFEEVQPAEGYAPNNEKYTVEVNVNDDDKRVYTVDVVNYPLKDIVVVKKDAKTLQPIEGVTFKYYKDNQYLGTTAPTDAEGKTTVEDVDSGTYRFEENKPAPGYSANTEEYNLEVDVKDTTIPVYTIEVKNYHLKPLTIRKVDAESNLPVAGVVFEYFKDGQYIGVTDPTDENGEILIPELDTGLYIFKEISGPPGYTVNPKEYSIYIDCKDLTKDAYVLNVENWEKRTVIIEKLDAVTGKRLKDAKFRVTSTDLNYNQEFTTDATGTIVLEHLKDGTYTIEEIQAPDGYVIPEGNASKQTVVLNPGSENTITVTFKNAPKTCIAISKVDSVTGDALEGAQFEVSTVAGKKVGVYTTDASGMAYTIRLDPGVYVVKEVKAPDGYELDSTPQNAIVETNNATFLIFKDSPKTTITITKVDATTGKALSGATFIVKDVNGLCATTEGTYTTGPDGSVTTSPVPAGKYYIYETIAPDGYSLNSEPTCVWVIAGEKNNAIVKNTELGSITILKTDTNNKPIAGCVFKVETADGAYIGQFTTDGSGEAHVPHVKAGVYVITEIQAPEGYEIDDTPQNVVVKDGQTSQITFNDAKKGGLIIHLKDQADGSDLADGQFTITRCKDNVIVATGTTDQSGIWMVGNLTPGKYIITHTYAAPGYTIIETEKNEFVVAGENRDVYFTDATAGLVVELVDSITGETIKNGRFQVVRNTDNIVIGEYVTDVDGLALVSRLTPGMYTVKCIVVPDGYVLSGDETQITHVKANETAHVTFKVTAITGITIHSVDRDTKAPLAGTKFEVWVQNGELVGSYTTDTTGTVQTNKLSPGFYIIKQIYAENGYTAVVSEMTVEIKAGVSVTQTFESVATVTLKVLALDESDKWLSGMKITVTKQNGEYVGEYVTGIDGSVTINGLASGYYIIKETEAPEGYVIKTETKTVEIVTTKPTVVEFEHDAIYGLQIRTSIDQTGTMVSGATYRITKLNGEDMGTYTSDAQGLIFVALVPGDYVVTQISVPNGYTVDSTPRNITVVSNKLTEMEFVLTQLSSIRVKFIDGTTSQAIYGVKILVKDASGTIVGEYTSNNEGYVELTKLVENGTYTIEMVSISGGYTIDSMPRTINVLNGETTEIVWKCYQNVGQIQIVLTSADYNKMTGTAAGAPIQGAEFQIIDPDTYAVLDTMTTDVNGVAASHGLPIGRYYVKQSKAAAYYAISDKQFEVKLKIANDVVREELTNVSLNIVINSTIKSNKQVTAGTTMRYDITSINNASDMSLNNFYWHIKVPTDVARIGTIYTGNWNNMVNYRIEYKTNMRDYTVLASNLLSSNRYQYDLSSTALGLQAGEYVTDARFVFGTVPAGFKLENNPAVMMYVLPSVYNSYKLIGRVEAGGQYNGYWYTGTALWTTSIQSKYKYGAAGTCGYANTGFMANTNGINYPVVLPKTGY